MEDDPLAHAITVTLNHNFPTSRYVHDLIHCNVDDVQLLFTNLKDKLRDLESGRIHMYNSVNPLYKVHDNYISSSKVNEAERVSWTRLRVSGHSLAVEEGRWNRRGGDRLPLKERLCSCGQIQTERHIIENCPRTSTLR